MLSVCKALSTKAISKVYTGITYRIVRIYDSIIDRRICGMPLTGRVEPEMEGSTGYSATCYWTLDELFGNSRFTAEDSLVDVGFGKGRVLAYLLSCGFPGRITGIEYDCRTAAVAKAWTAKYPAEKVTVIEGDAFKQQYDAYTVIYIFRPFSTEYFLRFIELLERQLTHPIRLYYMSDQKNARLLKACRGWHLFRRRVSYRKYGLCMWGSHSTTPSGGSSLKNCEQHIAKWRTTNGFCPP